MCAMLNKKIIEAKHNITSSPKFHGSFPNHKLNIQPEFRVACKTLALQVSVPRIFKCNTSSNHCKKFLGVDLYNLRGLRTLQRVSHVVSRPFPLPQNEVFASKSPEITRGPPLPVISHFERIWNGSKSLITPQSFGALLLFYKSAKSSSKVHSESQEVLPAKKLNESYPIIALCITDSSISYHQYFVPSHV